MTYFGEFGFWTVLVLEKTAHQDGHQDGVSLQISINLRRKLLLISSIRKIAVTWTLGESLHSTFFIFPDSGLIYWTFLIFTLIHFEWRDSENQRLVENRIFFCKVQLQTFAGVIQKNNRTRAVFNKNLTNYISVESLENVKFD